MKTLCTRFLVALLTLTAGLTGCRFGNYTEKDAASSVTKWVIGGTPQYFITAVLYAETNPDGSQKMDVNNNTSLSALPSYVTSIFTSPLKLWFNPAQSATAHSANAALIDYDETSSYSAHLNSKNELSEGVDGAITVLWKNQNCLTQEQITHAGRVDTSRISTYTDENHKTQKTNGTLNYNFVYQRVIDGGADCLDDLKELATCYLNNHAPGCTYQTVNAAYRLFDLYYTAGGILHLDDATLSKLNGLAYIVHFE